MTSDEPTEKIRKMKTALLDSCDQWIGDHEYSISTDSVDMIDRGNISTLKKERARMVEQLRASRHSSTQAIYQHDVPAI